MADAPVLVELGQLVVLHLDSFLNFKMMCEGLTSLVSPSNFVIMPFGWAEILLIEFKPESKSTQKSLQLLIAPIVSAVQMVTSDSCLGILIFGPW